MTRRDPERRWQEHVYGATRTKLRGSLHLWNAIRKYGAEAFTLSVLEVCPSLEEANDAEDAWISAFSTRHQPFGFNMVDGGRLTIHSHANPWERPEYRARREALAKEYWQRPEYVAKKLPQTMANLEKMNTPEVRAKMTATHNTPEFKAKRSAMSRAVQAANRDQKVAQRTELWKDQSYRSKVVPTLLANNAHWIERTHCSRGHEFTRENTRRGKGHVRICRKCMAARSLDRYHRLREAKAG